MSKFSRRVKHMVGSGNARRWGAALVALGTLAGVVTAAPASAGTDAPTGTSITVVVPQEPADWDFVRNSATAIRAPLAMNVVQPLLERQEDGTIAPFLAEQFEASDDGLTYTFTIREAMFHDGSPLDSADVVYSLETNMASEVAATAGPLSVAETIAATDEHTVVVTLSRPSRAFVNSLASSSGLIFPEGSLDSLATAPVGTGPWSFGEWRPDVDLVLHRFADYWGDIPYYETVTFRFITDPNAAANALLAGDVDILATGLGSTRSRVEDAGLTVVEGISAEFQYVSLNGSLDVFADERIRQAIAHAIDRQAYVDAVYGGAARPTCTFVNPPNEAWATDHCPYPYDPDRARELLAEAGAEGTPLTIKFIEDGAQWSITTEILVSQLSDVGFDVSTEGRELTTYLDEIVSAAEPSYEITPLGGPTAIDAWKCPGRFTLWCDPAIDEMLAQADETLDDQEYVDLRRTAIEQHADAAYLIPLSTRLDLVFLADGITGVKPFRPITEFDMRNIRPAEDAE